MTAQFQLVDVFGEEAFTGNPLAVVTSRQMLETEQMQRITRWLNLSETAFLLPPTQQGADYRVRIFTLDRELPFAGHPTLGTCHAWLAAGGVPAGEGVVQECGAGLVHLRRDGGLLSFAAPPLLRGGDVEEAKIAEVAEVLRIDRAAIRAAQWADNGPGWVAVMLDSAEAVLALKPAPSHHRRIDIGVVGMYPQGAPAAYEVRALFTDPTGALVEDPVTGSLNASLAQWLIASGRIAAPYTARQGTALGRKGRVAVTRDAGGQVWIGGHTATLVSGQIDI